MLQRPSLTTETPFLLVYRLRLVVTECSLKAGS